MSDAKDKAIQEVLKALGKKYDSVPVDLSEGEKERKVPAISTGCASLDWVLACGGLPRGRIMEVFGAEAGGKSTMAMFFVGQVQKQGGKAVWLDAEFSFDETHAKQIGVDTAALTLIQPVTAEEALDSINQLSKTGAVDIIVLDSVASLVPKKEAEGEIGKEDMALQARLMSKSLRVLAGTVSRSKTVCVFINQVREKIGIYWGSRVSTPGGKALKFYASIRLEVKKGDNIEKNEEVIGNRMKVCAVKNKIGMPFRKTEFDLFYSRGIDTEGDLLDWAIKAEVIKQAGAAYVFNEEKLGKSREISLDFLLTNPSTRDKIWKEVMEKKEIKNG